jgi:AraC-like DNA-binding protein
MDRADHDLTMTDRTPCHVEVRFCQPSPTQRRYFTTFYHTRITITDGGRVVDHLHPEWANLRMLMGDRPDARLADGEVVSGLDVVATGPTSSSLGFAIGTTRMWGIGLLPLGWARFAAGPASALADCVVDGRTHPAFADFRPLIDTLFDGQDDEAAELSRIEEHFLARDEGPLPGEARIVAAHEALLDPSTDDVGDFASRAGLTQRSLERLCLRVFGFAPHTLLRRQRFMRSLAKFMLDPSLKWIGAIDSHYHDQAQFVRDFHQFMGTSPRSYAAAPHPILGAIMRQRAIDAGAAVQALHPPTGADGISAG